MGHAESRQMKNPGKGGVKDSLGKFLNHSWNLFWHGDKKKNGDDEIAHQVQVLPFAAYVILSEHRTSLLCEVAAQKIHEMDA